MAAQPLPEPDDDRDRAILASIASYGWSVIGIQEEEDAPTYSFSVGIYHTLGVPELLIIGQKPENAQGLINNAGELMREGRRFTPGERAEGLLEGYPAVLVEVDPRYYREYLGYAGWVNRGWDFPVLQIVWPDLDGRFPWDQGYPAPLFWRQRVLGRTEHWPHGWPFPDPPDAAAFTTGQVARERQPIRLVTHDEDGTWQFHTGDAASVDDAMIVALEQMLLIDPSLGELGNLPCGEHGNSSGSRKEMGAVGKRGVRGVRGCGRLTRTESDSPCTHSHARYAPVPILEDPGMSLRVHAAAIVTAIALCGPALAQPTKPQVAVHRLRNIAAADAANALTAFVEKKKLPVAIVAEPVSNSVMLAGAAAPIRQVAELLASLDKQPPMFVARILVLEARAGFAEDTGLGEGAEANWVLTARGSHAQGRDPVQQGAARGRHPLPPQLLVADNRTGIVQIGATEAGSLTARVAPRIGSDGTVLLRVETEVKRTSKGKAEADTLQTTVKIADGGTLAMRRAPNEDRGWDARDARDRDDQPRGPGQQAGEWPGEESSLNGPILASRYFWSPPGCYDGGMDDRTRSPGGRVDPEARSRPLP